MGLCSFIQNYKRWSPISKVQGLQCDNPSCDWSDMNLDNHVTYFIIRNGDNLYRINSDVWVPDHLFPTEDEMEKVFESARRYASPKEIQKAYEEHAFIFLAIQGILDNTEIFPQEFRNQIDLVSPGKDNSKYVELVRDAEPHHFISDGKPSWYDFIDKNRESITTGTRVLLIGKSHSYKDIQDRQSSRYADSPSSGEIYQISDIDGQYCKFPYESHHTVYGPSWESHECSRRASFKAYRDELINVDILDPADLVYYVHSRLFRKDYLDILPMFKFLKDFKEAEAAEEKPFIQLLQSKVPQASEQDILSAIEWWKTNFKYKRALKVDDSKAYRMILARLNNPTYYSTWHPIEVTFWVYKQDFFWDLRSQFYKDFHLKHDVFDDSPPTAMFDSGEMDSLFDDLRHLAYQAACTHNVSINPRTKIALRGKAAEAATLAFHSLKLHIDKMYVSTKGELAKRFKLEDLFEDTQDRKKATYPHK